MKLLKFKNKEKNISFQKESPGYLQMNEHEAGNGHG